MSVGGRHVLLLCKKGASKDWSVPHDGGDELHVAFAIPGDQYQNWERRLAERDVSIEHRRAWPPGGQSIYFRDPDRHVVELATPRVLSDCHRERNRLVFGNRAYRVNAITKDDKAAVLVLRRRPHAASGRTVLA